MSILFKTIFIFILLPTLIFSKSLEKISIQLNNVDKFQFAGYYIAKQKGFYKNLNLDVKIIKYDKQTNNVINKVLKEEVNFSIGKTSLLIHKNNGKQLIVLAAIFQHSPKILLVSNKNIKKIEDLKNKKILLPLDTIDSASYMSMFLSEGLIKTDIKIQKNNYDLNDLINQKIDAMSAHISEEPYKLNKLKIPYKSFNPKNYGFDFYGDLLYTSKSFFDKKPKITKDFIYASIKGWEYAFENIEETAKLIFKKYNTQNKTLEELIYEGNQLKKLAYSKDKKIGHVDKKKFEEIAKIYNILNLIKNDYSLEDFIYCVHCFDDKLKLNAEEMQWLNKNKNLKVAIDKTWEPIEFISKDNKHSGISAGYKELIEKKLNIKLNIEENNSWEENFEKLKNNELDLSLVIAKTKQRENFLNFTSSYIKFPTVIVTKDNVGYIKDLGQLSLKTIALEKGYYTNSLIKKINPNIKIIPVNSTKEALKKVYNGSVFAYIGTLPIVGHIIKEQRYTNLKINGEAPFQTELSFASRKDIPILNSILEKTLLSISKEEHDKIYNKWVNIEYKHSVDYSIIIFIVLAGTILLLLLYIRNTELEKITETDTLTKIANRRKVNHFLEVEIEKSKRTRTSLSLIMIDIDFFKKINDTFGHKEGDKVLIKFAKALSKNIRKYELVGRWGGEEFIIICPNSDLVQAIEISKKLQVMIKQIKYKENNQVTASFGVAQLKEKDDIYNLIQKADKELYKAKNNGRDCIYPKV